MKIEDIIHVGLYLFLIAVPYISSKRFVKNYGTYIAAFMWIVILGWFMNKGQCILLSQSEETKNTDPIYKYGTTSAFFAEYLNVDKKYLMYLSVICELSYVLSAYMLARHSKLLQKFIIASALLNLYSNNIYA